MRLMPRSAAVSFALAAVAALAACGGGSSSKPANAPASSPPSGGTLTFCTDTTYPPMESLQGGKAVGADVDLANALAKLQGKTARIKTTGFDVIIPSLLHKKCDAIISSLTDNAERRKQVDFADYVTVGALLMVKKGNPQHISGLDSLSGKSVAVQSATTEKDALDAENKKLASQGKAEISIKIFPADTNAAAALQAGRVDSYFADATPVLYYIKKTEGKFEVAGKQLMSAPEGIATRKGDPLGAKLRAGIAKLYANGTMTRILAKWGVGKFALKK
jgi:polar amino acid transport system substrate-binding protein